MIIREKTSPLHYLCGVITAVSFLLSWVLPLLCFVGFLAIQVWTKKEQVESQEDFWEYVVGIFLATGIMIVLKVMKII